LLENLDFLAELLLEKNRGFSPNDPTLLTLGPEEAKASSRVKLALLV
jgi:hypothetical protein